MELCYVKTKGIKSMTVDPVREKISTHPIKRDFLFRKYFNYKGDKILLGEKEDSAWKDFFLSYHGDSIEYKPVTHYNLSIYYANDGYVRGGCDWVKSYYGSITISFRTENEAETALLDIRESNEDVFEVITNFHE